jgi:adenylate cyclase
MAEIFISYARSTQTQAHAVAEALRSLGYAVWRDDELPAHRAYADVIEERLQAAKAVVVIWSAEAVKSEWVQSEADTARTEHKLVQLTVDGSRLPRPFDRIQCADLAGWAGDLNAPGWRKVAASVADLVGVGQHPRETAAAALAAVRQRSICVLPFANMSGDPEQEYFSDGISEDIITDLSKVSALFVVARNTAFTFKGRSVDVPEVAARLKVSHVLEGSVRKAGGRVRITAQLIDGSTGGHVWAERYDRDLTDFFALQDEISQAIVAALKLKLLPQEKKAIERRGTTSVEAYDLYLMGRQYYLTNNQGDPRGYEAIVRLCGRAVEIDPSYAQAWALVAWAQASLSYLFRRDGDRGQVALDRALALDPDLAEAHALKARLLSDVGRREEAAVEIATAVRLDPESFEVNFRAGYMSLGQRRLEEAARYFESATALTETNFGAPSLLASCYTALGDREGARRAAQTTLVRAEKAVEQDRSNGHAMASCVTALAVLGLGERAKEWMARALLIDPENLMMRYNFACALIAYLNDADAALEMLATVMAKDPGTHVRGAQTDPDFDALRNDPRFQAMLAAAEGRLAESNAAHRTDS